MRLPTITAGQSRLEDAREIHERMWTATTHGEGLKIEIQEAYRIQGTLHRFWSQRGYRMRLRRIGSSDMVLFRLEPRASSKAVA